MAQSIQLFATSEDAAAFIEDPNAPHWYQDAEGTAGADAEEEEQVQEQEQEAPAAQAGRGLFGGGGAHNRGGAASASVAANVYVAPVHASRSSAGGSGGGGAGGTNLFGAVPPPQWSGGRQEKGPSRSLPRPTSEWIDRKIKEIRPNCGAWGAITGVMLHMPDRLIFNPPTN